MLTASRRAGATVACLLASLAVVPAVSAQEPAPPRAAKAQFDSGAAALKRNDAPRAVAAYRKAIAIDPAYYDAHEAFFDATRRVFEKGDTAVDETTYSDTLELNRHWKADSVANVALRHQYERWAAQHPKVAAYQWALGELSGSQGYHTGETPEAEPHFRKAVELDPKFVRAYQWLSLLAEMRGDDSASAEYLRKATRADTTDVEDAFEYAWKYRGSDPEKYRTLSLDIVRRFPTNQRSAQILYWVGYDAQADSDRIAIYERLRTQFPPDKFSWSSGAMDALQDAYIRVAPDKSLALAQDMLRAAADVGDEREWAPRVVLARNLTLARSLAVEHKYAAASAVLSATQLPRRWENQEMFALLQAALADSAGNTKAAYDSLLVQEAKVPGDSVHAALVRYATKLGKSAAQTDSQVWVLRDKTANPATPFRLASYRGAHDTISLADYKGKVVLLTFWFPGCGPCRGELPHFQRVINALQARGVAYVAINVEPEQDADVVPFVKGTHYSFTPLHGNERFAQEAYGVRAEPENFLIDGQGRIVFKHFIAGNAAEERTLTLMIQSILAHAQGTPELGSGR
jgi:Tfp pilus assembly protein PilF/thiol-disulfide isomerase/thioredoxin